MNEFIDPALMTPHFSTRIYRGYLLYLEKKFGSDRASAIIKKTGLTWDYLVRDSNWVSEVFAERFYEVLTTVEGIDPNFSYRAAELSLSREAQGPVQWLGIRLFDPRSVFKKILVFTRHFNKVDEIQIETLKRGSMTLLFRCHRQTKFLNEIVENWRGFLTNIPSPMQLPPAQVDVRELASGHFAFDVRWVGLRMLTFVQWVMLLVPFFGIIGTLTFLALTRWEYASVTFLAGAAFTAIAQLYRDRLIAHAFGATQNQFEAAIKEAEDRYNDLFASKEKLDRRYREANLLTKVLHRINSSMNTEDLIDVTLKEIHESLRFDRVAYLSYHAKTDVLRMHKTAGFDQRITQIVQDYTIDLKPQTDNPFHLGNVFRKQTPLLVPVTGDYFGSLSEEGKLMIYITKSKSFLAVPVASEKNSYGVLLVDYAHEEKRVNQDDLHIIQNIAIQLAISLENARILEKETQLRMAFQQFVPPQVMRSLVGEAPNSFEMGVTKTVTVLFSDLRDFTKHSTSLPPDVLIQTLNHYFKEMTAIVYEFGGIIDKFLGDGILAVFNAFDDNATHSIRAIRAACAMQRTIPLLNEQLAKTFLADHPSIRLRAGIAIHRGPVVLGTIGTSQKTEFTALGETVNVASRLVGFTKNFGGSAILASEDVYSATQDQFIFKDLGGHEIRGTSKTKQVYLVLGEALPEVHGGESTETTPLPVELDKVS